MQWFYDLKTIHKMYVLSFIVAVGIISVGFTGYYYNLESSAHMSSIYNDRLMPIKWLGLARVHLNANMSNVLEIILTDDKRQMLSIKDDIAKRAEKFKELISLYEKTKLDPYEMENLSKLKEAADEYRAVRSEVIELAMQNKDSEAFKLYYENKQTFLGIVTSLEALSDYNAKIAEDLNKNNQQSSKFATIIIFIVSILSVVICTWIGRITGNRIAGILSKLGEKMKAVASGDLTVENMGRLEKSCIGDLCVVFDTMLNSLRNLVNEVNKSVEHMSSATEEISAAIEQTSEGGQQISSGVTNLASATTQITSNISQLSEGTQQVAGSISQLASGVQQIAMSVENGSKNISHINKSIQNVSEESIVIAKLGDNTENNANEGKEHIKKAVNKIDSIRQVSGEISTTIGELGKLSSEIETIVDLIKTIAGQTNLLALNAAIEAARAGEHGKGFAVVADEVKKLATKSGEATDKITGMIKEIQNKTQVAVTTMDKGVTEVQEGVVVINNAGNALENIIEQVKQTNLKIQSITKEIEGIAKGSEEMVGMISDISSVTEETAASSEEIASITEQTAANAQEISSTIQESNSNTEEIASNVEEQSASLQEISASAQSLIKIAENLHKQTSVFKV